MTSRITNIKTITFILFLAPVTAFPVGSPDTFLVQFIQGNYHLIGKAMDSDQTFYGKVNIKTSDNVISIKRNINGTETHATGTIEQITTDNINALRIRFIQNNTKYEETCLIDSDLDNYARLTCHLYRPGIQTHNPGLEALFIDHGNR